MTIKELLAQANEQSVKLYLKRQDLELQFQSLQAKRQQLDMDLVRLDGQIVLLEQLKLEENNG